MASKKDNLKYRIKARNFIIKLKEKTPCYDCGNYFSHYVTEFDHKYGKISTIGALTGRVGMEKLLKEIAKCDLLCANCHKIRTHNRINRV
jgi:hypothetical protein